MKHIYENIDGFSLYQEQGVLLEYILTNHPKNNIKIAEIGVYKGRMTAMWNVILKNFNIDYEYYAIDHFLGSEEHDKSIDYYQNTVENLKIFEENSKLHIIKNDSLSESNNYENNYFDIIYIDGSHDYESVKKDIIAWQPKLKKDGIICGDDYVYTWPDVIKAVNEIYRNVKVVGTQQWLIIDNI